MPTVEDYYNGNDHGNYQYATFASIIDDIVEDTLDQDSFLKNTTRSQIIKHAKKGVREMNFNAANHPRVLEIDISSSLSMILPVDYVDWVRVSVLQEDGFLYALGQNTRMPTAASYLQDNQFEILFDMDGFPLQGDSDSNAFASPFLRRTIHTTTREAFLHDGTFRGDRKNIDTSYYNVNGEFKIDVARGAVAFSSELSEKTVVFEYISDGLEDEKIWNETLRVHKYVVQAIMDWTYWQIIRKRRNVNATEKAVARREYFNSRRVAKVRLGSMSASEIKKAMAGTTKWV